MEPLKTDPLFSIQGADNDERAQKNRGSTAESNGPVFLFFFVSGEKGSFKE